MEEFGSTQEYFRNLLQPFHPHVLELSPHFFVFLEADIDLLLLFFFFLTTSFKFRPSVNAVNTNAELRGLRSASGAGSLWTCSCMLAG